MNSEIIACFPQWANYSHAFRYICENGFGVKYLTPPPITKRTLELGSKYSPDYVCVPFKYCLGCYIEALEGGANCLMQIFGACRLDFYGELAERILRDMGYDFKFFNMAEINFKSPKSIVEHFKIINPKASLKKVATAIPVMINIIKIIDKFENYIRHNVGFERENGSFERTYNEFLKKLDETKSAKEVKRLYRTYWRKLKEIPVDKPLKTIKVGMVGDYYTVQEPYSNYFIEKELANFGIEIYREMNLTNSLINSKYKQSRKAIKQYAHHNMGATTSFTIAEAIKFAKEGASGIIQVKSFGCMPEIDAMPVLQNVGRDYKIPVLHFSFDSQTSETGVKTRLEAFYDMIEAMKK